MLRVNRLDELIIYDLSWRAICRNAIIEGIKALVRRKICGALLQFGNALSGHRKRQTKGPRGRFPSPTISIDPAEVVAEAAKNASSGAELRSQPGDRSLISDRAEQC